MKKLSDEEMKKISLKKDDCCAYSIGLFGPLTCVDSANEAEKKAGDNGWWACNTEEVKKECGY